MPGQEGYNELLQALEVDGRRIGYNAMKAAQKAEQLLEDDLFGRKYLETIRSRARECVVSVPYDTNNSHDQGDCMSPITTNKIHLIIKCNERLENLCDQIKHLGFILMENAEKLRGLIDLNIVNVDNETKSAWKNELIQMQSIISSNCALIITYYHDRSHTSSYVLRHPTVSDSWQQIIEIDEDFFSKLRIFLLNLRLFNVRLYNIIQNWLNLNESKQE
ncbi:unnamed protein product [Didymodactylos carnosus]|uniref:Proteasome activator PA28 C-terminal domain-containing protein n=1 Tax=Didymodactylos carnosus TaxID=1234261 RepID=A0A814DQ25_9BILA|nr:unnamed protein product [Didymodactylos carnosus]CAF1622693.1 unnamed protein product [Didymodactylos carnosus]CAF3734846.1 unnamed protein product [Didymodactylos carnosus]CAF4443089.1 unnamed protein product [Didymodactylos carnosus]